MNNTQTENERLVTVAKEAIASAEKLCIENKHPMLLVFARAIVKYDEELSALREKYRWRKQSEEPAPWDTVVFIRYLDIDGHQVAVAPISACYDDDGATCYLDIEWRPLELPNYEGGKSQ